MRRRLLTAAVVMALSGISTPQAFAAEVSAQDEMLVMRAHQGNLAEIAAGQDARKHATTDCVKRAGAVLVRDHSKLDADLRALAGALGVTLPGSPSAEQKKALAAVRAKAGGPAYDAAWLASQDAAHRKTLALIDQELTAGTNAEVKAAARAARPVVAMHLDMVRGGVCHEVREAGTVRAGSAGLLTPADDTPDDRDRALTPDDDTPDDRDRTLTPDDDTPDDTDRTLTPDDDTPDDTDRTLTPDDDTPDDTDRTLTPDDDTPDDTDRALTPADDTPDDTDRTLTPDDDTSAGDTPDDKNRGLTPAGDTPDDNRALTPAGDTPDDGDTADPATDRRHLPADDTPDDRDRALVGLTPVGDTPDDADRRLAVDGGAPVAAGMLAAGGGLFAAGGAVWLWRTRRPSADRR
jgi:putative membrane protein